jgi:NAD(P)-dependent dehydrogenase (short-subunit alcohol dehydrogenase family)
MPCKMTATQAAPDDPRGKPDSGWCQGASALVVGASGGIGSALINALRADGRWSLVMGLGRATEPGWEIGDEPRLAAAAATLAQRAEAQGAPLRLVISAVGGLHGSGWKPEKSWHELDATRLQRAFEVNAIAPALLMKHFLPRLAPEGRAVMACLSARVGSIGDNRLGGWYGYRAAKAALNQLVHTAAIELRRKQPAALCVALHPGTVDTPLSAPFSRQALALQTPAEAAARLLAVIEGLSEADNGGHFDHHGQPVPW